MAKHPEVVTTNPPAQSIRILTLVARQIGGVAVFWENLRLQFPSVTIVYYQRGDRTFFDASTATVYYNPYDPLPHTYGILAQVLPLAGYDVLVANELFELEFFLWCRISRPLAFIAHGNHEHSYKVALKHGNRLDHIFCVSETAVSHLRNRGLERVSSFRYSTFVNLAPSADKSRRVLYVGRLEPDKNIHETIELFRYLKTRRYEVRMIGVGSLEPVVRASLAPHEVGIGITRDEVLQEMAGAGFLCLLSYVEGLPIVYAEAMHFRLGVICNYVDKSEHQLLGGNYLLNSTPEELAGLMENFKFQPPPSPVRINNPALNEQFVDELGRVAISTPRGPAVRLGTLLDNLPGVPARLIGAYRAAKMKRIAGA